MNLNATSLGQALFILALVVIFFTVKFAKGKANNIGLVAIYAVLFNFLRLNKTVIIVLSCCVSIHHFGACFKSGGIGTCFQPKGEMRFSDMYKHFNSCNQQLGALCRT